MSKLSILQLIKPTFWGSIAKKFVEENFKKTTIITGDWGDPKPQSLYNWEGDYIVSFLSPWILPQEILDNA